MRISWRFPVCLLLLATLLLSILPAGTAFDRNRVVRVAYPIQAGLTEVDEDGNFAGYAYEYLEEVAQYTGWEYEFVQVPGDINTALVTLMEMVTSGEVDLMSGVLYSEAMTANFDYSSHSYGSAETVLQVPFRTNHPQLFNIQAGQPLRVAVSSLTGRQIQELETYCTMNQFTPEYVLCDDAKAAMAAVEEGRADVFLNSSFNNMGEMRTLARFAPKPFYFITGKTGDRSLMQELNAAMLAIDQADPTFVTSLYEKYFTSHNHELMLTTEEQAYLDQLDVLRVGFLSDKPPYQYLDAHGGPAGIAVDLVKDVAQTLNLELELVAADSFGQLHDQVLAGSLHMVATMPYDYKLARATNLSMTRPYLSYHYVLVTHNSAGESLSTKIPVLAEGSPLIAQFGDQVTILPTAEACIQAVSSGTAGYTYLDAYTAQYYLNLPQYQNLRLSTQTQASRNNCFGVSSLGGGVLLSILNKSLLSMDTAHFQTIVNVNTLPLREFSFFDLLLEYPVQSMVIIAFSSLLIIAILLYFLRQRAMMSRKSALELKKHYQVYALANEYFFEYDHRDHGLLIPCSADGQATAGNAMYRLAPPSAGDGETFRLHQGFVDFVRTNETGIHEVNLDCADGQSHWLRIALVTVYDGEQPAYTLGKINLIDGERQERESLLVKAHTDSLTGLYNTATMRTLATAALAELPPDKTGALLVLDIDFFKAINDTYGHLEGDATLVHLADLLKHSFREEDIVARPGGDEFLVFIRSIQSELSLAHRCTQLCHQARVPAPDGSPSVSISIGAVLARNGDSFDHLYRLADQSLYEAKGNGRDRFSIAQR